MNQNDCCTGLTVECECNLSRPHYLTCVDKNEFENLN